MVSKNLTDKSLNLYHDINVHVLLYRDPDCRFTTPYAAEDSHRSHSRISAASSTDASNLRRPRQSPHRLKKATPESPAPSWVCLRITRPVMGMSQNHPPCHGYVSESPALSWVSFRITRPVMGVSQNHPPHHGYVSESPAPSWVCVRITRPVMGMSQNHLPRHGYAAESTVV